MKGERLLAFNFWVCLLIALGIGGAEQTEPSCSFDDGNLCDWKDDWDKWKFGPEGDGPLKPMDGKGGYIYIRWNGTSSSANLSLPMVVIPGDSCLTFNYQIFGVVSGTLKLIMTEFIRGKEVHSRFQWVREGTTADRWYRFRDTITAAAPINVTLRFQAEASLGDIAIDNIAFQKGPCPLEDDIELSCDFEMDLCGWDNLDQSVTWTRVKSDSDGAFDDHTTSSKYGHYITLKRTIARESDSSVGQLTSPIIKKSEGGVSCLTFWYFLLGTSGNTQLQVFAEKESGVGITNETWTETSNNYTVPTWTAGRLELKHEVDYKIVVAVMSHYNESARQSVGIDDLMVRRGTCGRPAECNFDGELCGYSHDSNADFRLLVGAGRVENPEELAATAPKPESNGMYLYADTTVKRIASGQSGRIISEVLSPSALGWQNACLSFQQFVSGKGTMRVLKRTSDNAKMLDTTIWENSATNASDFQPERVTINGTREFQLILEMTKKDTGSFMAIDNVQLQPEECQDESLAWDCNFEKRNFCNWTPDSSWITRDGSQSILDKVQIRSDHTFNNLTGNFAYFGNTSETLASLRSKPIPTMSKGPFCISFWYWMHTSVPATLDIFLMQDIQQSGPVWTAMGTRGMQWNYGLFNLPKTRDTSVVIQAYRILAGVGDIAIDDIKVYQGECQVAKGTLCDFESTDICGMKTQSEDYIEWVRMKGATKTNGTGPTKDHTYGTKYGNYMVVLASKKGKNQSNNKARLVYRNLPGNDTHAWSCLRFYFHMFGADINELNVYMLPSGENDLGMAIWSQKGQHSDAWLLGQANVASSKQHDIIFEVVTGYGDEGDIAIDDVSLVDGQCPFPGSCDFDNDFCGYENSPTRVDLEWIRWRGQTTTPGTGPETDHTEENSEGYYVYLENQAGTVDKRGILQSEYLSFSSDRCLKFWAHMNGPQIGKLSVNVTSYHLETKKTTTSEIFRKTGNQGNKWFPVSLTLGSDKVSADEEYRLEFIGTTKGKLGEIALDDIFLDSNACYQVPEKGFDCQGGNVSFVNISQVCDFRQDCDSNRDEMNCGDCDFEHDFCGWTPLLQFKRGNGTIRINGDLPETDVTTKNQTGYYLSLSSMYASGTLESAQGEFKFKKSDDSCVMEFWYFMASNYNKISVRKIIYSKINSLYETVGEATESLRKWQKAKVSVGTSHDEFFLQLIASTSSGSALAVDDISFKDCAFREEEDRCEDHQVKCDNKDICINQDALCDLTDDCGDGSDELPSKCQNTLQATTFESANFGLFEKTTGRSSGYDWVIGDATASRYISNVGPINDHTVSKDYSGKYLYVNPEFVVKTKSEPKGRIVGPTMVKPADKICGLRFYYYLYGNEDDSLAVYRSYEQNGWDLEHVWSRSGSLGQSWEKAIVPVEDSTPFYFVIEGTPGKGNSRISIDDISFSDGCQLYEIPLPTPLPIPLPTTNPCRDTEFKCANGQCIDKENECDFTVDCADGTDELKCGPCDFTYGTCGWEDESTGQWSWLTVDEKVRTERFKRDKLPTNRNDANTSYVMVYRTVTSGRASNALFYSPPLPATSTHCQMIFWMYFPQGSTSGFMYVQGKTPRVLRSVPYVTAYRKWARVTVPIPSYSKGSRVFFSTNKVYAIIDEISFEDCDPKRLHIDCNFDDSGFRGGLCYWQNDIKNRLNWTRHNSAPATQFTGPTRDHTTGEGYFLYVGRRYSPFVNQFTRLLSPIVTSDNESSSCFSFWYHMYGRDVKSLEVKTQVDSNRMQSFWKRSGTAGNKWLFQEINIQSNQDYRVVLEAIGSTGAEGVIAVDDIKMIDGLCPDITLCDFEKGFCGWIPSQLGSLTWERDIAAGLQSKEKPAFDHSLKTSQGHFLLVRPLQITVAVLTSPYLKNVGDTCLHIWYNIYGGNAGNLSVFQKTDTETRLENNIPLKRIFLFHSFEWRRARVTLPALPPSYYVTIEGETGMADLKNGYMAIDDLQILDGKCTMAATCNFEIDECGWVSKPGFSWIRRTANDQAFGKGPSTDHTLRRAQGHYMFLDLTGVGGDNPGVTVTLESEDVENYGTDHCFSFYVYVNNVPGVILSVNQVYDGNISKNVAKVVGVSQGKWNYRNNIAMVIPKDKKIFNVQLEVKAPLFNSNQSGRGMAIDDITLLPYRCGKAPASSTETPVTTPLPSKFNCDFEIDLCNWNSPGDDTVLKFERFQGHSDRKAGGRPRTDRTTGSTSGHYAAPAKYDSFRSRASSIMETNDPTVIGTEGACIQFSYLTRGGAKVAFALVNYETGISETLWERMNSRGPSWVDEQIHIKKTGNFYLSFQGTHNNYDGSTSALDDIIYFEGPCPPRSLCDFESDECGFHNVINTNFTWSLSSAENTENGPPFDKSTLNRLGTFVFIDGSKNPPVGSVARYESGVYTPKYKCVQFWYYLSGADAGTINFYYQADAEEPSLLWSQSGDEGATWHLSQCNVPSVPALNFKYIFEAVVGKNISSSVIAIDDVQMLDTCSPPGSCNFEKDTCSWYSDPTTYYSWNRESGEGGQYDNSAGPDHDKTFGTQFGVYLFSEWDGFNPATFRLHSPFFPAEQKRCLEYWYYRNGTVTPTLILAANAGDDNQTEMVLQSFTEHTAMIPEWTYAQKEISFADNPDWKRYHLVFQGNFSGDKRGQFLGLDDIDMSLGDCPAPPGDKDFFYCDGFSKAISQSQVCNFHPDCVDETDESACGHKCDFDTDTCGWALNNDTRTILERIKANASDPALKNDHTLLRTGEGYFLSVKDGVRFSNKFNAEVRSPDLTEASSFCSFSFWYFFIKPSGQSDLEMDVFVEGSHHSKQTKIFHLSESQTPEWHRAVVNVGRVPSRFKAVVSVYKYFFSNYVGVLIGLDDFQFENCALPQPGTATACGENEFLCDNKRCIDKELLCDYNNDCGDIMGSDEISTHGIQCEKFPGRCDFERNLCDWKSQRNGYNSWSMRKDSIYDKDKMPDRDHTKNSFSGKYVYFQNLVFSSKEISDRLMGPVMRATGKQCRFRFFYQYFTKYTTTKYEEQKGVGTLSVILRRDVEGVEFVKFTTSKALGFYYEKVTVDLRNETGPFQVLIEAVRGSDIEGTWVVDDVSFSEGCAYSDQPLPQIITTTVEPTKAPDCAKDQFTCEASGMCLDFRKVCDFINQCPESDNSDEDQCAQCDFTIPENPLCGWLETSVGRYSWSLVSSTGSQPSEAPPLNQGPYLIIRTSTTSGLISNEATLESRSLGSTVETCQMGFEYFINSGRGDDTTLRLEMIRQYSGNETMEVEEITIWKDDEQTDNQWLRAFVPIRTQTGGSWRLRFKATIEAGTPDIGIAQIYFQNCPDFGPQECKVIESQKCDFNYDCPDRSDEQNCTDYQERCDFEGGFCNWKNNDVGDQWLWISGQTLSEDAALERDHTLGTATGRYLYYPSSKTKGVAVLRSTQFEGDISGQCQMRFWYHMYGQDGSINVYIKPVDGLNILRLASLNGTLSLSDDWYKATITLVNKKNFEVLIEGIRATREKSGLAIDDISFTPACVPLHSEVTTILPTVQPPNQCDNNTQFQCLDQSCLNASAICNFKSDCSHGEDEAGCPDKCNFENGWCGWWPSPDNISGFSWNVTNAEEAGAISDYPVMADVTLGSDEGHFLFLRIRRGSFKTGQLSTVSSPMFVDSAATCKISFYYTLRASPAPVSLVVSNRDNNDTVEIWYQSYRFGQTSELEEWQNVTIGLGRRKDSFGVTFQANSQSFMVGSFGIDEIKFTDCALPAIQESCPPDTFECWNSACVEMSSVCDLTDDCGDETDEVDCEYNNFTRVDFENGISIFEQGENGVDDHIDWRVGQGLVYKRQSQRTGPAFDHTFFTTNGSYLYVNKGQASQDERAWLKSPIFRDTANHPCVLRFNYHMLGSGVNKLTVFSRSNQDRAPLKELFLQRGDQGDIWHRQSIELRETEDFQIIFEARVGKVNEDIIAIDDISFTHQCSYYNETRPDTTTDNPTTTPAPTNPCPTGFFSCAFNNRVCVPNEDVCNLVTDCGDGSDEKTCVAPECNFEESNMCGWQLTTFEPRTPLNNETVYAWRTLRAMNKNTTVSRDVLPAKDVTMKSGEGWYAYADAGHGNAFDWTSLNTPVIQRTGTRCTLEFWTYCGGSRCNVGLEMARYNPVESLTEEYIPWMIDSFAQKNVWMQQRVFLGQSLRLTLALKSTRDFLPASAISIDGLHLVDCAPPAKPISATNNCGPDQTRCLDEKRPECVDIKKVCDYAPDCTDGSDESALKCQTYKARCDFSSGFCPDWQHQSIGTTEWKLKTADPVIQGIYPNTDRSTRKEGGKYISVPFRVGSKNATHQAYLASYVIKSSARDCWLRMWYNIIGTSHKLEVYRRNSYKSSDETNDLVLVQKFISKSGADFWDWEAIPVSWDDSTNDFEIAIVATVTNEPGSVNLDDLSLTPTCEKSDSLLPGEIDITTPHPTCGSRLPCGNGNCYTHLQKCNFIDDCGDGTDEVDCGKECDFERDTCGWFNQAGIQFKWKRATARDKGQVDGPTVDHSQGNEEAFYLTSSTPYQTVRGDIAHFNSPTYSQSGAQCKFTTWYFMNTAMIGNLTVYLKRGDSSPGSNKMEPLTTVVGSLGKDWRSLEVKIGAQRGFAITVEATYQTNGGSYGIALDDFKFQDCEPGKPILECAVNEWQCYNGTQCLDEWERCDAKIDCEDGSDELNCEQAEVSGGCTFDQPGFPSSCKGWIDIPDTEIKWSQIATTRHNYAKPDTDKGGHGSYLFMDSSKAQRGWRAAVAGPVFKASEDVCHVTFWYNIAAAKPGGQLRVLTLANDTSSSELMFHTTGTGKNEWVYAHVPVGHVRDYRVVLEGTVLATNQSDIAIDEARFSSGCKDGVRPIQPTGSPKPCEDDQFQCGDGKCINKALECDCHPDCENGEDEDHCTKTCESPTTPTTTSTSTTEPTTTTTTSASTSAPTTTTTAGTTTTVEPGAGTPEPTKKVAMTVGFIFGCIAVALIVLVIAYQIRKRRRSLLVRLAPNSLDNPLFGLPLDDLQPEVNKEVDEDSRSTEEPGPSAKPTISGTTTNFREIDLLGDYVE